MEHCDIESGICKIQEGNWIPISEYGKLQPGDLLETPSMFPKHFPIIGGIVVPIVNHYGVYLEVDGKPMVVHNPFDGKPELISLEQFESDRKVERVIRTGLSSEYILEKFNQCKHRDYKFLGFNCEEFISYICGSCPVGFDQRKGWALFGILIVIILILALSRKRS